MCIDRHTNSYYTKECCKDWVGGREKKKCGTKRERVLMCVYYLIHTRCRRRGRIEFFFFRYYNETTEIV
jgi:hypothetical protein